MDEKGLKLSLHVMEEQHGDTNFLAVVVLEFLPINLLLKRDQNSRNQHWAKILNQEDKLPRNLHS